LLLKDLYKETYTNKVLVFPNSRGRAEEVAVKLKRIAEKVNGHTSYYSHHSSVDRELREWIVFSSYPILHHKNVDGLYQ
jgi:ATP-dependent Lhr-like helicase